ncbi:MAG: GTP cyclohydrolase I FolE2 [Candidimonas sp.]|nr:MAG: GTP cyclohydrolase I FolE2 [Candidimonas sp.]TAM20149.1 MAG: GTP cyclohydrolase I FolE2 [Candidimonas sp.]TAM80758.1 MAG: GTP cyclohydrolase I FolE2 [Candidimonas sp.]
MNSPLDLPAALPDVQSSPDGRHLVIQRVGIRRARYPMRVAVDDGSMQATIANWTLTVELPAAEKGTHMSRFMALLEQHRAVAMTPAMFGAMTRDMLHLLNARRGDITAQFPYFITKSAPVSGVNSLLDYDVQWTARAHDDHVDFEMTLKIPVTSLCPCSKAISRYGAHNQRSHVTVFAVLGGDLNMDQLIRLVEQEGSCELWGLLKRPDEKYVTEYAYNNPKFVEDLVRDVAVRLEDCPAITRYRVEAENFESIHNHSAYAVIER